MSLKFLAVGQSLAGIRADKSPYALKKENQLPTFPGVPRFMARQTANVEAPMIQADFLQPQPVEAAAIEPQREPMSGSGSVSAQKNFPPARPRRRRWLSFLRWKWFRSPVPKADMVQSELSLEKVRVIRNDLADSDLELVLKKKKKAKPVFAATQENNGLARQGWTELTAKLFEIGQK